MKKLLILTAILIFGTEAAMAKTLVVYFSKTGSTRAVAEYIKDATKADIFEIVPVQSYPEEYKATTEQAKKEINDGYKPAIKSKAQNIADYDIIFVGSPCWWGTIAPPVATFLSSHDLSGKIIIPFMTHGGSGLGHSVSDIKKLVPNAIIRDGKAFYGSSAESAKSDVEEWLKKVEGL
jgi:flavodoxin